MTQTVEFARCWNALSNLLAVLEPSDPMRPIVKTWLSAMAAMVTNTPAVAS